MNCIAGSDVLFSHSRFFLNFNQVLEKMLESPEWKHFGAVLDGEERDNLNNAWHRLRGL
jgi:hypothetical protein